MIESAWFLLLLQWVTTSDLMAEQTSVKDSVWMSKSIDEPSCLVKTTSWGEGGVKERLRLHFIQVETSDYIALTYP